MRKLATIREISEIKSIPDADLICAYQVDGWWVVDGIGKYNIGDQVCHCEIDSWIPTTIAEFLSKGKEPKEFNGVKGERLRTVKLKGQLSQGLLLPLSVIFQDGVSAEEYPFITGSDVTELLGIQKWEPPVPVCLSGLMKGNFPSFCHKSDQERIENLEDFIFNEIDPEQEWEVTVKFDGSSTSVYFNNNETGVCSRNIEWKLDQEGNGFVDIAKSTGLLNALTSLGRNIQVLGELIAPNIQSNRHKVTQPELYVFDIFDIDLQVFLSPIERYSVFQQLKELGFSGEHVLILFNNTTLQSIGITDVSSSKYFVDRGYGRLNNIEGCVFKSKDGQFSFKSINNKYLLKYEQVL